ncbi:ABC transporter ATP-binding protein [Falsarthrobacter nasiphocae]|uniref:ABC-2 type transport system ATP-binding protein n=1 Tax=Falsarthrobacter nasiphocae TaxID=189863 RepID=A0AAE3YFD4_9MICC|nr:ABC transporter ATP-binding protein [Falsarthrobacter nasiphocae]MDR6892788.1 ABC-2 type transport system ATP-binding protein [Falsarthrobacter nasiphocae]
MTDDTAPSASLPPVVPHGSGPVSAHPALSVEGLSKAFGQVLAVDSVSFEVPSGSFFGLVGPNGAGKTTLLSMATGLLRPSAGTALVYGKDILREPDAAKQLLGVMPDGLRLFDRLTGPELLEFTGRLRGLDQGTVKERAADLLELMDLTAEPRKLVTDYSAGMKKKITLAAALIHAPRLLVLDEPFEAVDPVSAANIRDVLAHFVAGGGTVIVSSHVMDLVQRMCDHVAIVAGGRLVASGTVDEVRAGQDLESRFIELVGGRRSGEGLAWLEH